MNEQLRELELEAIAYADGKVPAMDRYNDIYHSIVRGKFAELIVGECMEVANTYQNRGGNCYVDNMIAKHFGVEE